MRLCSYNLLWSRIQIQAHSWTTWTRMTASRWIQGIAVFERRPANESNKYDHKRTHETFSSLKKIRGRARAIINSYHSYPPSNHFMCLSVPLYSKHNFSSLAPPHQSFIQLSFFLWGRNPALVTYDPIKLIWSTFWTLCCFECSFSRTRAL